MRRMATSRILKCSRSAGQGQDCKKPKIYAIHLEFATHRLESLYVANARFLGVTPQDIVDDGPEDATHPLSETDLKRAKDPLEHDPQ